MSAASDIVSLVMGLKREDGEIRYEDLFPDDDLTTQELAAGWMWWDEYRKAAATVERVINAELASRLGDTGGVTVLGWRIYQTTRKDEKCVDTAGFHAWLRSELGTDSDLAERLFNPNDVRVGQLPPVVRSTFFEKVEREGAKKEIVAVESTRIEEAALKRDLKERAEQAREEANGGT